MKQKKLLYKILLALVVLLILLFLASPMLAVVGASFSNTKYFQFPPESFSLRWYKEAFRNKEHIRSLMNSLKIAGCTMLVADVICIPACFALTRCGTSPVVLHHSGAAVPAGHRPWRGLDALAGEAGLAGQFLDVGIGARGVGDALLYAGSGGQPQRV